MITDRELSLAEWRMARGDALAAQPRQLLNITPKSLGAPWPFDRIDFTGPPGPKLANPYRQSPWVQRAINIKAAEITAVPVKFYAGDQEYTSPEFAAFWERPFLAPGRKRHTLAEGQLRLVGWLDLRGACFILRGDDWLGFPEVRTSLSPLIIASPDRMRPVESVGELIGWVFTDGSGRGFPLLPEQVEHVMYWDPENENRGLSPVESILNAAETDYLAGVYTRNLMRNNGDQGVYVIAKGGVPTDPQREQIIQQLRDKRRAAARGDFRPVFLTGDIAVEDAKAQLPDANLNATRLLDRHTVFIGLGVPASMADVQQAYSIGSNSDRALLITGTCMALAKKINSPLGRIASRQAGRELVAESDWDEHHVMQAVRRERIAVAVELWDRGWSWKTINDYLDLGMHPFPGWEIAYMPFNLAPVDLSGEPRTDPAVDPALQEEPMDTVAQAIALNLLARQRTRERALPVCRDATDPFAMFACEHEGAVMAVAKARSPKQLAQWRALMAKRVGTLKSFQRALGRVLMEARMETLRKIEAAHVGKAAGIEQRAGAAASLLFDLAKFALSFTGVVEKQQKLGLQLAGEQLFEEIGKDDPFQYPPEAVLDHLAARKNKLKNVPQEIYDRVKEVLEEGYVAGDSQAGLEARVKTVFNELTNGQAKRISLTETGAVYGAGRHQAMRQSGVPGKAWLTSGNANVRAAHEVAGEEYDLAHAIPVDEPFVVDGEALQFPGDDAGSAGNVINCHCASVATVLPKDEEATS